MSDNSQSNQTPSAGPFLRKHRLDHGIKVVQVARRIGKSAPFVSQIESGREVPLSTVLLIATAIGELIAEKTEAAA